MCAARAGQLQKLGLVAEAKVRNDLAIAFEVGPLEIVEQALSLADHLQQSATAVMILGVGAEVVSEVVDVLGEDRYLHVGRTRIVGVLPVLLYSCRLLKCHFLMCSPRAFSLWPAGFVINDVSLEYYWTYGPL